MSALASRLIHVERISCFLSEWIRWYYPAFAGIGVTLVGTVVSYPLGLNIHFQMFFLNYWKTSKLYEQVKNHRISKHQYSLTIRYQLQENLWCGKVDPFLNTVATFNFIQMMKNIIFTLVLVNTSTFLVSLPAVSDKGKEYFGLETVQFLDCLYNILIVVYVSFFCVKTSNLGMAQRWQWGQWQRTST